MIYAALINGLAFGQQCNLKYWTNNTLCDGVSNQPHPIIHSTFQYQCISQPGIPLKMIILVQQTNHPNHSQYQCFNRNWSFRSWCSLRYVCAIVLPQNDCLNTVHNSSVSLIVLFKRLVQIQCRTQNWRWRAFAKSNPLLYHFVHLFTDKTTRVRLIFFVLQKYRFVWHLV